MMGYTKWIAVLFCLLGMTACRQDAPRFRIGVAQCSDDSWRHKMNDEILREAMFMMEYRLKSGRLRMIIVNRRKTFIIYR